MPRRWPVADPMRHGTGDPLTQRTNAAFRHRRSRAPVRRRGRGLYPSCLAQKRSCARQSKVVTITPAERIRSGAIYLKVPALKVAKVGGKHWIKEPLALLAAQGAAGKATTDQLKQANPAMTVRMLIASGDLRKVGPGGGTRGDHHPLHGHVGHSQADRQQAGPDA